eukprot:scaffold4174_cov182-Ochromonas_danica.AAC.6
MSCDSTVSCSNSTSTFCLFLGDLSLFCTEKDIVSAFSAFGNVINVRIKRSNESKKHLLYGFVEYESASEAVQAMKSMNGTLFLGRTLKVRWAASKCNKTMNWIAGVNGSVSGNSNGSAGGTSDSIDSRSPSVFVAFMAYQGDKVINEAVLRAIFEKFGSIGDVVVKQSKQDAVTGYQKGYAFVQFSNDVHGIEASYQAASHVNNGVIDGVGYKCEVSHQTEELRRQVVAALTPSASMVNTSPPITSSCAPPVMVNGGNAMVAVPVPCVTYYPPVAVASGMLPRAMNPMIDGPRPAMSYPPPPSPPVWSHPVYAPTVSGAYYHHPSAVKYCRAMCFFTP